MAVAKKPAAKATKRKPTARRRIGPVEKATRADLAALRVDTPALADSGLAATAVAMAREVDADGNSATSKSMCAARLADILAQLRALAPPKKEIDAVDRVAAQRDKRRAAAAAGCAATADLSRT